MSETELIEALLAELREYGEIFIEDETVADYPGMTWRELERAIRAEMGEEIVTVSYDVQLCGYRIKRLDAPRASGFTQRQVDEAADQLRRSFIRTGNAANATSAYLQFFGWTHGWDQ